MVDVNDATRHLFGVYDPEAFGDGLSLVFDKESYEVFKDEVVTLAAGRNRFSGVAIHPGSGGARREVLVAVTVPPGVEQTWSRVLAAVTEVTSLVDAGREYRAAEEKYRKLFAASPHPVLGVDAKTGIVVEANQAAGLLLGTPVHDLTGRHLREVCAGPEAEALAALGRGVKEGPGRSHGAIRLRHRDGKTVRTRGFATHHGVGQRGLVFLTGCGAPAPCKPSGERPSPPGGEPTLSGPDKRSPREREVLRLIGQGHTNDAIARSLSISPKTVESHPGRLMQKLGVRRAAHLVRLALAWGLTD